jgi:hypothetical protein
MPVIYFLVGGLAVLLIISLIGSLGWVIFYILDDEDRYNPAACFGSGLFAFALIVIITLLFTGIGQAIVG